jgi:hypothetical protein
MLSNLISERRQRKRQTKYGWGEGKYIIPGTSTS